MCGCNLFQLVDRLLPESAKPGEAARPVRTEKIPVASAVTVTCPQCRSHVSANFSWCPTCGAGLKARPCMYCGQTMKPGESACPNCGAPARRTRA